MIRSWRWCQRTFRGVRLHSPPTRRPVSRRVQTTSRSVVVSQALDRRSDSSAVRGSLTCGALTYQVTANVTSGWDYFQLPDPGAGYTLYKVVRSDGTVIPVSDQAWTTDRTISPTGRGTVDYELHILDDNSHPGRQRERHRRRLIRPAHRPTVNRSPSRSRSRRRPPGAALQAAVALTVKPKVVDVRVEFGGKSMSLLGLGRDLPFIRA